MIACMQGLKIRKQKNSNLMIAFAGLWKQVECSSHEGHPHTVGHPLPHQRSIFTTATKNISPSC